MDDPRESDTLELPADDDDLFDPRFDVEFDDNAGAGTEGEAKASADPALAFLRGDPDPDKAEADALFQRQLAEAESLSKWRTEPEAPLTELEEAAKAYAALPPGEASAFMDRLREANERQAQAFKAGTDGFDDEGLPLPEPEAPFDPMTLSGEAFRLFQEAVVSGGASFTKVPAGETYDSWSAKVNSALGR